jgi:hypothetical protein
MNPLEALKTAYAEGVVDLSSTYKLYVSDNSPFLLVNIVDGRKRPIWDETDELLCNVCGV